MTGLELRDLAWRAGPNFRLDTSLLHVACGEVCVIDANPRPGAELANVLLGLAPPLNGEVTVGGRDVTTEPPGQRSIALVPPGGGLLPHLTVERNVAFGLAGMAARHIHNGEVHRALHDLQLESLGRLRPHEISPVQRLRVAVARALCSIPRPGAVVIEDRQGQISCRAAVMTAVRQEVAVLVITDALERAGSLEASLRHAVEPADAGTDHV
jgi:ABC-type thiamine transport system ATPase subunit